MKAALRIAQIAAVFGITTYAVEQMVFGGLFARGVLGIHWLYITMFLAVLIAYFVFDNINVLYIVPIGVVYYCVHEALFNIFFISYNGFRTPFWASTTWYEEMATIAIVTPTFLIICWRFKGRFFRTGTMAKLSICLWSSLIALYFVRMAYGFPVSINIYDIFGVDTASPLANEFELATNTLFAFTFFSTFRFAPRAVHKSQSVASDILAEQMAEQSSLN